MKRPGSTALTLADRRLVVCLGPGGVGKTTISAALALHLALGGRKVDVMTVDPAPRLLDALGLRVEDSSLQPVSLGAMGARGGARLRALKLDPKRVFDRLIERHAPSAAARDAILADRVYRNLSNALAGVADYMAMEQLLELSRAPDADMIVLDTPPAAEALDFLGAPRRMLELLGSRAVTLLGAAGGAMRGPFSMLDLAARAVLGAFDRVTGLHLLGDVRNFVRNFSGMYAGFAERAEAAGELLRDPRTLIVVVATAERERIAQAIEFVAALNEMDLKAGAIAINRLRPPLPGAGEIAKSRKIPESLRAKLQSHLADLAALQTRERAALDALHAALPDGVELLHATDLGREPRSLADLAEIAKTIRRA